MKRTIPFLITLIKQGSLVKQIIAGLVLGILVALAFPGFAQGCGVLGSFFVSALKAVAPVLVFVRSNFQYGLSLPIFFSYLENVVIFSTCNETIKHLTFT